MTTSTYHCSQSSKRASDFPSNADSNQSLSSTILTSRQDKVNLSLPLGVAYEYRNLCLDLRYNLGMTNVMDLDLDGISSKNRTIMLTLGYGVKL